jgi:nucleoside-diphosphate-sugar epimerase
LEAAMAGETVLVTGGSGYIGGWCIIPLLQQGYQVRTTVRSLAREAEVRARLATQAPTGLLRFFAADLMSEAGWDEAAAGCEYVLHVASPLGVGVSDPQALIKTAREGAIRAIRAAIKAGAKRVVMTSSVAATDPPHESADVSADETVWTDPAGKGVSAYAQSKTLAERAAWDLIAREGGATTLAVVNPALVLGPVLGGDYSESLQVVERLMTGRVPGIPRLGFSVVDVRDVADLHLKAMLSPEAAGQRFIAAHEFRWMSDVAEVLRARLGPKAAKVPTRRVPDVLVRLVSLFDKDLKEVTPALGRKRVFSSEKAQRMLGWRPRPADDTIVDCAESLISHGLV